MDQKLCNLNIFVFVELRLVILIALKRNKYSSIEYRKYLLHGVKVELDD